MCWLERSNRERLSRKRVSPEVTNASVCLTFDFDTVSSWLNNFGAATPGVLSRGEFGGRVGVWRVLDLLDRYSIPATFFVPGYSAETFPGAVKAMVAAGHEVGHHSYRHESPTAYGGDVAAERRMYVRGLEAIEAAAGVRPVGYRSPGWDLSWDSVDILRDLGFAYDSSLAGDDFTPYFVRRGDVARLDGGYVFGEETPLVELPVSWNLDDFPQFEFVAREGFVATSLATPSKVFEIWQANLHYMVEHVPNGVLDLTMHPQTIGRGHGMVLLERVVRECLGHSGLRFLRAREAAEEFRTRSQRTDGREEERRFLDAD